MARVFDRILGDAEYKRGGDSVQMDEGRDCVGLCISDNTLKSGDESTIKITTTVPSNASLFSYRISVGLARPLRHYKKYKVVDNVQELEAFLPLNIGGYTSAAVSYRRCQRAGRAMKLSPGSPSLGDIYRQTTPSIGYTKNNLIWVTELGDTYICDNPESVGTWRGFDRGLCTSSRPGCAFTTYRESEEGSEYDIDVMYLKVKLQDSNGTLCNIDENGETSKVLTSDLEGEYVWVGLMESNGLADFGGVGGSIQLQVDYL